jgi:hypothetical protein
MPVQLVLFDLGRVLIRLCDDWKHACRVAGVPLRADLPEPDEQTIARAQAIVERYDTGQIDGQTFAREVAPLQTSPPTTSSPSTTAARPARRGGIDRRAFRRRHPHRLSLQHRRGPLAAGE